MLLSLSMAADPSAGDDTLLVVVADDVGGRRVAEELEKLGAGN